MEVFIGQVQLLPYTFAPRNWALCEGQLIAISQNQTLFALLGTQFGGDGRTTFGLPNLIAVEPNSAGNAGMRDDVHYMVCTDGTFPRR